MTRINFIIGGAVVIMAGALLISYAAPSWQQDKSDQADLDQQSEEIVESEPDSPEQIRGKSEVINYSDDSDTLPVSSSGSASGSGFNHKVDIKVNGVVEENKNEGWWKID